MTWLIDEDNALWTKLQGYSVQNYSDGALLPIQVYYRFPDDELITRKFPHIGIDLVDIHQDPTREMRAFMPIMPFPTETTTPPFGYQLVGPDWPLPYVLEYQLAAFSTQPWHDRQLGLLLHQMFPDDFGFLDMRNWDGTVRRADLLDVSRRDRINGAGGAQKRLYCQIFTIAVSSEFTLGQLQAIQEVTSIEITTESNVQNLPV